MQRRCSDGRACRVGFRQAHQKVFPSFRCWLSPSVALITSRMILQLLQLLGLLVLTPLAFFFWHRKTKYGTLVELCDPILVSTLQRCPDSRRIIHRPRPCDCH